MILDEKPQAFTLYGSVRRSWQMPPIPDNLTKDPKILASIFQTMAEKPGVGPQAAEFYRTLADGIRPAPATGSAPHQEPIQTSYSSHAPTPG